MPQRTKRPDVPAPSLLRRLARENTQMGQRLAQLEFRVMLQELSNPSLFDLNIDFPGEPRQPPPPAPPTADRLTQARLPALNVPLGKIAWVSEPEALPIVGIFCPDCDHSVLLAAMRDLMKTYNELPFARLVFICASLRPIPFFLCGPKGQREIWRNRGSGYRGGGRALAGIERPGPCRCHRADSPYSDPGKLDQDPSETCLFEVFQTQRSR